MCLFLETHTLLPSRPTSLAGGGKARHCGQSPGTALALIEGKRKSNKAVLDEDIDNFTDCGRGCPPFPSLCLSGGVENGSMTTTWKGNVHAGVPTCTHAHRVAHAGHSSQNAAGWLEAKNAADMPR